MSEPAVGVAVATADVGDMVAFARAAEDHGLDHVSVADVLLGDGTPSAEPMTAAAAIAARTHQVGIEFGVLVLPLRHPVWTASHLATLQNLSGGRVTLGVGTGGFPGTRFWRGVGAPEHGRGAVLDATLDRLPGLLAGTDAEVTIAPTAPMPPVLVGGGPGAVDRANRHRAGWFPSLTGPALLAEHAGRVAAGRVHVGLHAALGDDRVEARERLIRDLVGGMGLDADRAEVAALLGGADELGARITDLARAGATSVTVALDGADPVGQLGTVARGRLLASRAMASST